MDDQPETDWLTAWVPAPCDACPHWHMCAAYHRACAAYELFHDGASMRRWMTAPREPTRQIYSAVFEPVLDACGRRLRTTVRGMQHAAQ